MLLVYKNFNGDLELEVNGIKKTIKAFGVITDIDDSFYKEAKKKYSFLAEWEKQGIIEVGQNIPQKEDALNEALRKQKELESENEKLNKIIEEQAILATNKQNQQKELESENVEEKVAEATTEAKPNAKEKK